jgi:flagellar biosynthesis protein
MTFHTIRAVPPDENDPKPRQRAIALGYDAENDAAPRVMASGEGLIAEKIIALAKENGIPIREDTILANALASLDLNDTIPPELYSVVAEVLAYVYRIREKQLIK